MPTTASTYRLGEDTLAQLDRVAAHLSDMTGREHSRADAIRFAAREADRKLREPKKKSEKTAR